MNDSHVMLMQPFGDRFGGAPMGAIPARLRAGTSLWRETRAKLHKWLDVYDPPAAFGA